MSDIYVTCKLKYDKNKFVYNGYMLALNSIKTSCEYWVSFLYQSFYDRSPFKFTSRGIAEVLMRKKWQW